LALGLKRQQHALLPLGIARNISQKHARLVIAESWLIDALD
jgi:hypothetical protein